MIATTEFLPRLLHYVVGCSQPLALQAIVDAAIAFCDESLVVRRRLDPQTTRVGASEFDLDGVAQQAVSRVLKVWVDGRAIPAIAADRVDDGLPVASRPQGFYTAQEGGTLMGKLHPVPDGRYTLDVEVALRPTRKANCLADELFNTWMDAIIAGALGVLASIPDQPFTNFATGQNAAARAAFLARKARIDGAYGRVRGTISVRQRPFA